MNRSNLRQVEWNEYEKIWNEDKAKMNVEVNNCIGYFHMWFNHMSSDDGCSVNNLYAIVETEEGNIIHIDSEKIRFIKEGEILDEWRKLAIERDKNRVE